MMRQRWGDYMCCRSKHYLLLYYIHGREILYVQLCDSCCGWLLRVADFKLKLFTCQRRWHTIIEFCDSVSMKAPKQFHLFWHLREIHHAKCLWGGEYPAKVWEGNYYDLKLRLYRLVMSFVVQVFKNYHFFMNIQGGK